MSEKVQPRHVGRKAMLYIRQSTMTQVRQNEESRRLQYAMRDRLHALGWKEVDVIDEDLGKSASGSVARSGFQRLVAEVSLGEVGVVAAREVSRFARNSRDWQKLIEICKYVDTLLVDHDAVYDTRASNDRLLLGLKGSLNEYELEILRVRAHEARLAMVGRGEFYGKIAVGYRKNDVHRIEKTPDARVQSAVRLVFQKFLELGSARQVLIWFRAAEIQLPVNRNHRGDIRWRESSYSQIHNMLVNPVYAGAYAYGRTKVVTSMLGEEVKRVVQRRPRDEWIVLLRDRHEAYITWTEHERIREALTMNSQARLKGPGVAGRGPALLVGLLRCRRCGEKLVVAYSGAGSRIARYHCSRRSSAIGERICMSFASREVDEHVKDAVLAVVSPAGIEASLVAIAEQGKKGNEVAAALLLDLKAARYEAERAQRQFDAADPENRLVVDELERRWNHALERAHELEVRIEREKAPSEGATISDEELRALSRNLRRVWDAPATDVSLKKRIIRTVLEEIVADVVESEIVLILHWKGGAHSELRVPRMRRGQNRAQAKPEIEQAIRELALVCDDRSIAAWLNKAELTTGRGDQWRKVLVASFRSSRAIPAFSPESVTYLVLSEAAALVGLAEVTLKRAIARGALRAHQPVPRGPWIIAREELLAAQARKSLTKKSRPRLDESGVPSEPESKQLTLAIPRR